jgi:L-rhamnose mutarotase
MQVALHTVLKAGHEADYAAMRAALRDDPDNLAWQATVGPFFDQPDSYEGTDSGLGRLWTLAGQLGNG